MSTKLTSLSNPKIKNVVRLRQRKCRDELGLTIVEGIVELESAKEAGLTFMEIYVCPELNQSSEGTYKELTKNVKEVYEVTRSVYEKIAYGDRKEGFLGVCQSPGADLKTLKKKKAALYIVLEHVEKPGNLGAILRTVDAVGATGVIVCDIKTDLYNPNVIRSSRGTIFTVPTVICSSTDAVAFLKKQEVNIAATLPDAKNSYDQVDFKESVAIVLGSEDKGLTHFWKDHSDISISIPMKGQANSLNVSVSAAVILYEANRQRQQ